jgi:hypothetical protein
MFNFNTSYLNVFLIFSCCSQAIFTDDSIKLFQQSENKPLNRMKRSKKQRKDVEFKEEDEDKYVNVELEVSARACVCVKKIIYICI